MADFKLKGIGRFRLRRRTVLGAVLVVALLVVAWTQRETIASVLSALSKGAVVPLVAAAVLEGVRVVFHALAYTRAFKAVGARVPLRATVPAWFKAVFMNTVLPSGGTSGLAAVVDAARQRGVAVGSATSAALFTQSCFYSAMLLIIVVGFVAMAQAGTLQVRDVLLGCVMGVVACAFLGLLAMGHLAPGVLQRFMRRVEALAARLCARLRFVRRQPKPWADALVHSFSSAATELSRHPRQALSVFASMVAAMFFDMLAFVAAGYAFGVSRPDALFGGYVTALVFNSFNVTPGGVGVVEGLAAAVLAGYGYPLALALSAVLAYRAVMYWIPFLVGGVMMHATGAFGLGRAGAGHGGAAAGEAETVYVRRRHPEGTLRERAVAFARDTFEVRTAVCALLGLACALSGFAGAALPADPVMTDAVTNYVLGQGPADPVGMVVCAYLLFLCLPGILMHDQGNWLLAMVALLGLGFSTALSGHGGWVVLLVMLTLAFFAAWHGCFDAHGFLQSLPRLMWVLVYGMAGALLYALVGALFVRAGIDPDPGFGGALWLGLQATVARPDLAGLAAASQALWFFASVRAVTTTLLTMLAFVVVSISVRRARTRAVRAPKPGSDPGSGAEGPASESPDLHPSPDGTTER